MVLASAPDKNVFSAGPVPNALTIDVEDYYQVSGFESRVARNQWHLYPSRVKENTERLLVILRRRQVRATFFVLGWVGQNCPDLVRQIRDEGHEIGAHSFWHHRIYTQSPKAFREDLVRTVQLLGDLAGQPIRCYRAPSFSITRASWWALEILVQEGFRYDCSVFPIWHDRYGAPGAPLGIYRVETAAGPIWEFPPAVYRFLGIPVPCGGGGYFRLYPLWWSLWCLRAIRRQDRPFLFYLHPWELDPQQPRLPGPLVNRFRHYWNLSATARRLEVLLDEFPFAPVSQVMEQYLRQKGTEFPVVRISELSKPTGIATARAIKPAEGVKLR